MNKIYLALIALLPLALHSQESSIINEFTGMMEYNSEHVRSLAEAIPEDKYDWAPSEGVRNTGEVVNHISAAWYFMASMLGAEIPEGVNPGNMEVDITDKEEIIEAFNDSYKNIMEVATSLPVEEYDDMIYFPPADREVTKRFMLLLMLDHLAEHKGQLIAYARSNGVVPPWSE